MTENQLSTDDEGAEGDPRPNMVASLDVRSFDGSPEVITGILGLQPSRSGQAGYPSYDVLGKPRGHIVRNSFWSLRSGAGFHASIEEHANDLLHQIHASRDAFPLLPVGSVVVFDCTIIPGEYLPSFTLGARVLRELGAIGAAFKLDIIRIIHTPNDVTPETWSGCAFAVRKLEDWFGKVVALRRSLPGVRCKPGGRTVHDTLGNGRKFRTFTLDDTPGHVFGRGEFIDALSCMALPMLFQWDAHFVSATGQLIAFVSHEGYVDLICRDDRVYATLRDRLKDFDPEDL